MVQGFIGAKPVQLVKSGDTVSVAYNLTLENGTLIDSTANGKPYTFVVGSSSTIKGFSYGIIGMRLNETKTFSIEPKDAYGEYDPSLVETTRIGPNQTYTVGEKITSMMFGLQGTIIFVNSTHATADFNTPLAGKTLVFTVTVLNINKTNDYLNP
jgi:FKBP-type peptidyl-prolyl cis-trans isomerase 2